jgi:hypothetical protein
VSAALTASGLASVLTSRLQALWGRAVEVTGIALLPGGASRESWDVRVRIAVRPGLARRLGEVLARIHRARLAALGCADDAALCAAIRDGSLDHRFDQVAAAVRAATVDKLTVANPGHLAQPG